MASAVNPAKRCMARSNARAERDAKFSSPAWEHAHHSHWNESAFGWPFPKAKSAEKPHIYAAHSRRLFLLYFGVST
jgi:hypothetical protein